MLNICCVKYGTKYGPEYVNILFDMVRRNLKEGVEGRFICFTDDPTGLDEGIETKPLPSFLSSWWTKLYLFSEEAFPKDDRVIYFDLDVVITGWLDDLVTYQGDFAILKEFYDVEGWQSSIMAWRAGAKTHIWTRWLEEGKPEPAGGDQDWIEDSAGEADMLQDLYPGAFLSYKVHCLLNHPPLGTKVVVFHGEPKPDNCGEKWVEMIWKVGGGSAAELELVCNTEDEKLKANIAHASALSLPWLEYKEAHDGHAVIVGGAPSVYGLLDELKWRQEKGQVIFALNNSASFLRAHGIYPDYQVIIDARPENAEFIKEAPMREFLLCSSCHPSVFDKAREYCVPTTLWHCYSPVLDEALINPENKPECLIAAGTTVGLNAMALSFALGFRKIHVYGMDSSLSEGSHHAYPQSLNDSDRILEVMCEGRIFQAAAWMVAQANQFQFLARELVDGGAEITVHGDGLLPAIAKKMEINSIPDNQIIEKGGLWWPSKDVIGKEVIGKEARAIPKLVSLCAKKDVAVQAGGNVGLFPRELSNHFEKVVTFEPDPLNFRCLELNCNGNSKIEKHNAGLSDAAEKRGMYRDSLNCGAHFMVEGDEVVTTTVDSLSLDNCDLLQLDVEGYELKALKGAETTIDKFKPVISLELKSLGKKYGTNDQDVIDWLSSKNYKQVDSMGKDKIFVHTA